MKNPLFAQNVLKRSHAKPPKVVNPTSALIVAKASLNVTSIKQILDWVYEDETK